MPDYEKRLEAIEKKLDSILDLLRGKNTDPGLIDDVRDLKRFKKTVVRSFVGIVAVLFSQIVIWLRIWFRDRWG